MSDQAMQPRGHDNAAAMPYVVVARRYRPQTFAELVGQEHIGQALAGAIASQRVGHAYLFTGARGVGKTSAARIFAKALNCEQGPTATPCNQCDICRSISTGDDVDVLEIDGASNRGIDEIRQLRQNVNVRASRSRYKIYIIDEVHMLTREAFNALLKTLEEPPEHVKFIFCTTEPEKIPITILSRCQRFDFAGIQTSSIASRLQQIVTAEGVQADPEALETIARRAAGSMRDSQSLLEQLLASGGQTLTVDDVHRLLGTAADKRLATLVDHLTQGRAAEALTELDAALGEGVDSTQLLDQLLGYFRDLMIAAAGGSADTFLYVARNEQELAQAAAGRLGLETILAAMQIIDTTLARMRHTTRVRTLAELALVRICRLGNLEDLAAVIHQFRQGTGELPARQSAAAPQPRMAATPLPSSGPSVATADKKKELTAVESEATANGNALPPTRASAQALTSENVSQVWQQVVAQLPGMLLDHATSASNVAILAPNRLAVYFPAGYTTSRSYCQRPEQAQLIEKTLQAVTGQLVRVEFELSAEAAATASEVEKPRVRSAQERMYSSMHHPLVQRANELFELRPQRID